MRIKSRRKLKELCVRENIKNINNNNSKIKKTIKKNFTISNLNNNNNKNADNHLSLFFLLILQHIIMIQFNFLNTKKKKRKLRAIENKNYNCNQKHTCIHTNLI